jgi:hypothetical protein
MSVAASAGTEQQANGGGECPRKIPSLQHQAGSRKCALPVDDESFQERFSPWTHRPYCVQTVLNSGDETKYCTFTCDYFGNHGFSIITRPERAAYAATILDTVYLSPFPSLATVRNLTLDRPYRVVDLPGKGKGVVASRLIRQHEVFMIDYVSIVTEVGWSASLEKAQKYELLTRAADQLVDPQSVTTLSRLGLSDSNAVDDVVNTNQFNSDFAGTPHNVLFAEISVSARRSRGGHSLHREAYGTNLRT